MKLMIASDIHGDRECLERLLKIYDRDGYDKLILLGDILYHGPRNDLPSGYAPKGVIELLNEQRSDIIAVRGNCDTEVDQMVLQFPIMSEYSYICTDGLSMMLTHGHKHNAESLGALREGEILLAGHTHILAIEPFGNGNLYINPGSVSIPKGNNPKTYACYLNREFRIIDLDGKVIKSIIV